jgi:hypothetical protein
VDDRVPGVGGEGEKAGQPAQSVVVAEQQPDGVVGAQRGVPQGPAGLDDPVFVRPGARPELAQPQPRTAVVPAFRVAFVMGRA